MYISTRIPQVNSYTLNSITKYGLGTIPRKYFREFEHSGHSHSITNRLTTTVPKTKSSTLTMGVNFLK